MKILARMAVGLSLGLSLLVSCDDDLSRLGESVQTPRDKVESEQFLLQFEAETVLAPQYHQGRNPDALLGGYSDEVYGDFKADFATQLRTAPGFAFSHTPEGETIDSVVLRLSIPNGEGFVGLTNAPLQVSVYEIPGASAAQAFQANSNLSSYAQPSQLLGERVLRYASDTTNYVVGQSVAHALDIKLSTSLGQRIYDASKQHADYFQTQSNFVQNILGGLYVTTTAGQGIVLKVQATSLRIHYHYKNGQDTRQGVETFINTKLTSHTNGLQNSSVSALLNPTSGYLYSKGPAGVQVAVRLQKSQMERLLANQPADIKIGTDRTLADTQFKLEIDNPETLTLNPPLYMMLLPKDSVSNFFEKGLTERTAASTSYLSSAYVTTAKYYNFNNISRVLTEHLSKHAKYTGGRWQVDADLELRLIPVSRQTSRAGANSSALVTTAIDEYLFPSFVRLKKSEADLKIGVLISKFK